MTADSSACCSLVKSPAGADDGSQPHWEGGRLIGAVPLSAPPRMISGAIHGTFEGLQRGVALMDEVGLVEPASKITDVTG